MSAFGKSRHRRRHVLSSQPDRSGNDDIIPEGIGITQPVVLPFLMFQGNGSAALEFYGSVFPDAKVEEIECYGPREAGPEGSIKRARFSIGGQSVLCTDRAGLKFNRARS
jgi:hypothetical protein